MTPEEFTLATDSSGVLFGDGFSPVTEAVNKIYQLSMLQMYDTTGGYDDLKAAVVTEMWAKLESSLEKRLDSEAQKIADEVWGRGEKPMLGVSGLPAIQDTVTLSADSVRKALGLDG